VNAHDGVVRRDEARDLPERERAEILGELPGDVAPGGDRRKRLRQVLLVVIPIVFVLGGIVYYLLGGRFESTDNAYVAAGIVNVSANVSGRVVEVSVRENERVARGDVLFRLDPAPFQARVDEAEAAVAAARLQISSRKESYQEGLSEIASARDRLDFARREQDRQQQLLQEGIASQAQYDRAALEVQQANNALRASERQNQGVLASLSGDINLPVDEQPAVRRALAELESARLNLGYTVVRASIEGVVTKVNQLQVGDYVNASQPVFALFGTDIWVEANFKEDQLAHMRLGQRAGVEVDAFPGVELTGRVASFSPGTGNSFSVLPAENATGNWVKVVQRLPVQIELDRVPPDVPLHAGLSAEVTVDTGHRRTLFGIGLPRRSEDR
jgi:membrane fusion protein (multidrug efflux system)